MNSPFKFLRRVRIHGGECGAVARALHHEVKSSSLYQADSGKALESTNERKQMSTKTTLKRIALVAVSAMGFGMLSIVSAPVANASDFNATSITIGTVPAARVGELVTIPVTVNISAHDANETITVAAKITSAPSTSKLGVLGLGPDGSTRVNASSTYQWFFLGDADGTSPSGGAIYTAVSSADDMTNESTVVGGFVPGTTAAGSVVAVANAVGGVAATAMETVLGAVADATTTKTVYLSVKPDIAGTYTAIISVSGGQADFGANVGSKSYVAGQTSANVTITTAGSPTAATITAVGGSSSTNSAGSYGALFKVSFTDASGAAATLSGDESFTITPSSGTISKATLSSGVFTSVAPSSTSISIGRADVYNGVAFFNAKSSSASATVTLSGVNSGSLASAISAAATYTTAAGGNTAAAGTFAYRGGTAVETGWAAAAYTIPTTSTSDTVELTYTGATSAKYGYLTITDTAGKIAGTSAGNSLIYDRAYTQAALAAAGASYTTIAIPHAACAAGTCYTMTDSSGAFTSQAVTAAASSMTGGDIAILSPASSVKMAAAGSLTYNLEVTDQFGLAKANQAVAITISGRNSAKTGATVVTGADGTATYTLTDSGTSGVTDSITFTATVTESATITYGDVVAGSVLVTTPNTLSTGADEYPLDPEDISAADGAEAGVKTVTALVKDANAVVMSGVLVTWTVTGDGCALLSSTVSGYTGAAGTDTASVYAWKAGTCTVTATAGGKSDSAPAIFAQETPTEARTIAATVSGNQITATVTDRFGNTIEGVPVKVTRTAGTGYFGSASTATANTDAAGTVTFIVTGGSATVTVGFETSTYGQSDALKGLKDGTTATSTFTAYTAGTALEAEEGVGASFDAAGVNSVSVSVTASDSATTAGNAATAAAEAATDAAAEAIDAANAATDAANLAAEAADAATVAAEEARDAADAATAAVEELATQVATLMAALKAQITTLANTVAKIAKKVKA